MSEGSKKALVVLVLIAFTVLFLYGVLRGGIEFLKACEKVAGCL